MADDLKQFIEEQNRETRKHFDEKTTQLEKCFDEKTKETKRHFDVVAENLEKNIVGAMKEELDIHGQRLDRVEEKIEKLDRDVTEVKDSVAAITVTLESRKPAKSNGLPFLKPNYENL